MNVRTYIIIFSLLFCLPACQYKTEDSRSEITTSNLYVDHLNIWVKNPKLAKERLTNIGFTAVPDTLLLYQKI